MAILRQNIKVKFKNPLIRVVRERCSLNADYTRESVGNRTVRCGNNRGAI
jgi:hypothetical protein